MGNVEQLSSAAHRQRNRIEPPSILKVALDIYRKIMPNHPQSNNDGDWSNHRPATIGRREMLRRVGDGFGACALLAMLSGESQARHHPAKANAVIQIFCPGGMSHVDTWDYRPELERLHGQSFDAELGKQTFAGVAGEYAKSFWPYAQNGECRPLDEQFVSQTGWTCR